MPTPQARYWLLTIPVVHHPSEPKLAGSLVYLKGQQEIGEQGLHHWQLLAIFEKPLRRAAVKRHFCDQAHCEESRSAAANDYVWKEDTRVQGTQFEHGELPFNRGKKTDWDGLLHNVKHGRITKVPSDVYVRYYGNLKKIEAAHQDPVARDDIQVNVFWGTSGTGKTRRAWHEAGDTDVYVKNPGTKWWDGYRGQTKVLVDEFAGVFSLQNFLTWCDRYPTTVEVKGGTEVLRATQFWFTSNVDPRDWYADINQDQREAVMRRITNCVHFGPNARWEPPVVLQGDDDVIDIEQMLNDLLE